MSAKVLCFASAKGGAGKTALTASVGALLSALGKRVLLIDTDAATNGLTLLYIKEVLAKQDRAAQEGTVVRGLFEVDGPESSGFKLPTGVTLIPATYDFVNTEGYPPETLEARLVSTLKKSREDYDYILLDAQAGSDPYACIAMSKRVSDVVVLVAEYDPMSAAGLERLKGLLRDDLTYSRTWILLNKILPEFAKNFSDFLEIARYLSPIPWDAEVVRAYARRRLALDTENGNAFTIGVLQTVRGLLGEEIENEIKLWTETRAEAIRQPINVQYSDLEQELGVILEEKDRARTEMALADRKRTWLQLSVGAFVLSVLGLVIGIGRSSISNMFGRSEVLLSILFVTLGTWAGLTALLAKLLVPHYTGSRLSEAKLERRRAVIEDQLKKLEVLRAADPESLLRNHGR
jgi:septum site-determining protein MinD